MGFRMMVVAGLLAVGVSGVAQGKNDESILQATMLARFCGSHSAKMKELPARLAAELTPEQRTSLAAQELTPEYVAESKKMEEALSKQPEAADALCRELAEAPAGGIMRMIDEEGVLNGLTSFYPAVVGSAAKEYAKLPLAERDEVAKRLADMLAKPEADDIARGRVRDAFRAIGPDAALASAELAKIIRGSAGGGSTKSETVAVDPTLRSGGMVSNSATVTMGDTSAEVMGAAFEVLAEMKPLPVATLCQLAADPGKKVRMGAAGVFAGAKMPMATACAKAK